jgi:hypothetical protein
MGFRWQVDAVVRWLSSELPHGFNLVQMFTSYFDSSCCGAGRIPSVGRSVRGAHRAFLNRYGLP